MVVFGMRNGRGLEMAVTTVIMIILSIAVLTILIVFVNSQTSFLSKWFGTYESESNVDMVVSACNSLVAVDSVYSYCCEEREIVLADGAEVDDEGNVVDASFKRTCSAAREEYWSAGRIDEMSCVGIGC